MKEVLPVDTINSAKPFAIYGANEGLISEHDTSREVVLAYGRLVEGSRHTEAEIYRRNADGWESYLDTEPKSDLKP